MSNWLMRKRDRKLIGIAGDVAGHAKSKGAGLHPFLGDSCREQGFERIRLDLTNNNFNEVSFIVPKDVALALTSIKHKLVKLLKAQNFELSNLKLLEVEFIWDKHYPDWQCEYKVAIETDTGEKLEGKENAGPRYFV